VEQKQDKYSGKEIAIDR